jgi:hypothetical protein
MFLIAVNLQRVVAHNVGDDLLYVTADHLRVVRSCCRLHDMHALPNPSTEILLVAHFAYFTKSDS